MPKKGKAAKALVKYGPLVYAAAQRYGPTVWDQVRQNREPVQQFAQAKAAKGNQRKKALAHAKTLVDGNVMQVFHANEEHWVVFTGQRPVAVHPATDTRYEILLQDADLDRRIWPKPGTVAARMPKPGRRHSSTGTFWSASKDNSPDVSTGEDEDIVAQEGRRPPRALPEG